MPTAVIGWAAMILLAPVVFAFFLTCAIYFAMTIRPIKVQSDMNAFAISGGIKRSQTFIWELTDAFRVKDILEVPRLKTFKTISFPYQPITSDNGSVDDIRYRFSVSIPTIWAFDGTMDELAEKLNRARRCALEIGHERS
ncbi:hypothetical protein GCM10010990_29580 [Croceicoccus mobilis]|uniref:Uncharacterized protein n=2 Tax=Croceicoccus mobilis TaxID=1703339 RepID=A0A917DWE1_9SPHN|nr:hypothetical protein GCM10010990_29580 [Croceicoccus mobilis]